MQRFSCARLRSSTGPNVAISGIVSLLIASRMTSSVVLVEGTSDEVAVRALAGRLGRQLEAEGVQVLPIGGAQAIRRVLGTLPAGARAVGLCDEGEAPAFERALGSAFFVCVR